MWDDTKVEALRKHHQDGLSASQIADHLNTRHGTAFSRNAVISKLHRSGIVTIREAPKRAKGQRLGSAVAGSVLKPTKDVTASRGASARVKAFKDGLGLKRTEPKALPMPDPGAPAEGLTFMELELRHCRFAVGERDGEHIFCGADRQPGSAYCPACHARAYTTPHRTKNFKYRQPGATIEATE